MQRTELYSITSSATASSLSGTLRGIAFVLLPDWPPSAHPVVGYFDCGDSSQSICFANSCQQAPASENVTLAVGSVAAARCRSQYAARSRQC